jgi:hypothetical protein
VRSRHTTHPHSPDPETDRDWRLVRLEKALLANVDAEIRLFSRYLHFETQVTFRTHTSDSGKHTERQREAQRQTHRERERGTERGTETERQRET